MKRWAIGSIAFLATSAFAIAVVSLVILAESRINNLYPLNDSVETPIDADFELEIRRGQNDWRDAVESDYQIKLMTTGEGFWADEIEAKSDEEWLGLFPTEDGHELRYTRIKVTRAENGFEDEEGEMKGKSVSVTDSIEPYFLLKDADDILAPGPVKTLIVAPDSHDYHEDLQLRKGFDRSFELAGATYRMRVFGTIDSPMLVLESNGTRQAVYEVIGIGDATWELLWVGDLDGDNKLDFYADLPTFYNFSQRRLFLSSFAEQGGLLKQVALFHNTGC